MVIKKYTIFNSEKLLESLILESNIYFSTNFMKILDEIDSEISNQLKSMQGNDYKIDSNYIDIDDDKNDTVTFIPDKKAQEFLKDKKAKITGNAFYLSTSNSYMFKKYDFPNPDEKQEAIPQGTTVEVKDEFPSRSTPGRILCYIVAPDGHKAIINKNSLEFSNDKDVWKKGRSSIRIGRLIKKLLTIKGYTCSEKDVEQFVNTWKAQYDIINDEFANFELVQGEDIRKWYLSRNYERSSGTLGNSCMQYDTCQPYFDCYCNNKNVSMLIQKSESDNEKISGRAIVWTLDDGMIFMDRIYTIRDSDVELFKLYAKKKGWAYKRSQNSSEDEDLVLSDKTISSPKLKITLSDSHYEYFPYMDTMKYFHSASKSMTNYWVAGAKGDLTDTEGNNDDHCHTCHGEGNVSCPDCDGRGSQECTRCDGNGETDCPKCEASGNVNCDVCEGGGLNDCAECDGTGEVDGEECTSCEGKGDIICEECEGNGEKVCDKCDGDKHIECSRCDGDGSIECDECGGDGETSCPDC